MSKTFSLIACAVILAGCAGTSTQTADNGAAASEDGKPEKRCRYVKTTTSRLGQKVCEDVSE